MNRQPDEVSDRTLPATQPMFLRSKNKPRCSRCRSLLKAGEPPPPADRDRLLLEQMPQVKQIARKIHNRLPRHIPLEDLIHAGVLGLVDAFEKFDKAKHVEFSSYAKFRITGSIIDSLRELDWGPRALRRRARKLGNVEDQLSKRLGRMPTEPELATAMDIGLDELQSLRSELNGLEVASLQESAFRHGRNWEELCESIASPVEDTPFLTCLRREVNGLLSRLVSQLPEKERRVLWLYYFKEL